jgi:hypothetical protein
MMSFVLVFLTCRHQRALRGDRENVERSSIAGVPVFGLCNGKRGRTAANAATALHALAQLFVERAIASHAVREEAPSLG